MSVDLFLDCEWADTLASELVSLALVSADGHHTFYAERDPLPVEPVPWVSSVVYPLLDRGQAAMADMELTHRLRTFLAHIPDLRIVYSLGHDRSLCQYAIDGFEVPEPVGPAPAALRWKRVDRIDAAIEHWWQSHPEQLPRRHHALIDAMAFRGAVGLRRHGVFPVLPPEEPR